jgi:hypothetical protein
MKQWQKILIAIIGTGLQGGLTYAASIYPSMGQTFTYLVLAISGIMSSLIAWPPREG